MNRLFDFTNLCGRVIATLLLASTIVSSAFGATEVVDGIEWSYTISNGKASVGNGEDAAISVSTSGAIVIPSTLGGCPVVSIEESAFKDCSGLTSMTIQLGVTNISEGAFSYCSRLTQFVVNTSNPAYKSVNGLLLSKDGTRLIAGVNGDVVIPSGVTNICNYAFRGCSGLTSVTIPAGVTGIGARAFYGCKGLTSMTIPAGVTGIGKYAFYGCSGLTIVTIPSSVTNIGDYAFRGCSGLTSVTIPAGVTGIGKSAFYGCSGLTSVALPSSVTNIGDYAFRGCSGLTSVTIPAGVTGIGKSAFYGCRGLASVMIPPSVTNICEYAFRGCSGLTSVTIQSGVTSIGDRVFYGCSGLTSVTIPASVTNIGYATFSGCSGLTQFVVDTQNPSYKSDNGLLLSKDGTRLIAGVKGDVVIPSGVTNIVDYAFYGCKGLMSVTIPSSVTSIGRYAFYGCSGLTNVAILSDVTVIGDYAFRGCSGLTQFVVDTQNPSYKSVNGLLLSKDGTRLIAGVKGDVVIPSGVTNIVDYAFYDCSGLTSVTIPSSVTSIGDCAFYGCKGLTSVTIPSSVTSIGDSAFEDCSGLTSVAIPSSVTSIGAFAFSDCSGLTSVTIPSSVTSIGDYAFEGCSGLTSVTIPSSVTSIGEGVFEGCSGLTSNPVTPDDPSSQRHLVDDVEGLTGDSVSAFAATTYNGYLYRKSDGAVMGTVQVKAAKAKVDRKTGAATSKLTISVLLAAESKKISISGNYDLKAGGEQTFAKNGRSIALTLGANGLTGSFEGYVIDGATNVFTAKDADSKAAASAAEATYVGAYNLIADEGTLSVTVAKKGKVKVSGTLANGKKVSVSTQLIVGEAAACVPVTAAKYGLAFMLWLDRDAKNGIVLSAVGLTDAVVGKAGTLVADAQFTLDADALAKVVGDSTYAAYFPTEIVVSQNGTRWVVAGGAKAGKVSLNKKTGAIDEAKLGANPSALKLTYTAKTGAFKGSFKAYINASGKPKAVTVSVAGVLIDGVGYGTATIKKLGSCSVMIGN